MRTRIEEKSGQDLPTGVIPIWFEGDIKENFPGALLHLPARTFEHNGYFESFFELLIDIFADEDKGLSLIEKINAQKKAFMRQKDIPEETLRRYGQQFLEQRQFQKESDGQEIEEALFEEGERSYKQSASRFEESQQPVTLKNSSKILLKKWGPSFQSSSKGYIPEMDESFVESIPEGGSESYLIQLGNKLNSTDQTKTTKLLITGNRSKVAVTGLGGIGKSTLALSYAHFAATHKLYEVIHWIHAEDQDFIHQGYRSLLKLLKEPTDQLTTVEECAAAVSNALQDKKYLLIFDNVGSPDDIRDILPQGKKGHIIITSRHDSSGWDETIEMDVFSAEQAVEYIFEQCRHINKTEETEEISEKLAKKLGCLPLALSQMTSYVSNTRAKLENEQDGFKEYLKKLKERPQQIFSYEDPKKRTKKKTGTKESTKKDLASVVYTTWDITLDELNPFARTIMGYFSYLNADDIPIGLFKTPSLDRDEDELEEIIDELKRYSIIKITGGYVSLHRLVQMVGRAQQEELETNQTVIETLLKLFVNKAEDLFQMNLDNWEEKKNFLSYLPHLITAYEYGKGLKECSQELLLKIIAEKKILIFIRDYTAKAFFKLSFKDLLINQMNLKTLAAVYKIFNEKDDGAFDRLGQKEKRRSLEWLNGIVSDNHQQINFTIGMLYFPVDYTNAAKWLKRAAEQRNASAQMFLGTMYENGQGVEKDDDEAIRLYRLSAEQGDAIGQACLGGMYISGKGVKQDYEEALKWLNLAVKQGSMLGQRFLGIMYELGKGVKQDNRESARLYRLAAEQGDPEAQVRLGVMHIRCQEIGVNYEEAAKWLKLAAEQGDANGQVWLGTMYLYGEGVEQNKEEALSLFKLAAEQGNEMGRVLYLHNKGVDQNSEEAIRLDILAAEQGDASAQISLGTRYYYGRGVERDYTQARNWLEKAAQQDNSTAKANLSFLYKEGQGVDIDLQKAVALLQESAEAENSYGLYCLGVLYRDGEGVPQDDNKAVELFKEAAEGGSGDAFYALGWMHEEGRGVEKDTEKADDYYKKGEELHVNDGIYDLGRMCEKGLNVPQDLNQAKKWYAKSAALGNELAKEKLGKLARKQDLSWVKTFGQSMMMAIFNYILLPYIFSLLFE